MQLYIRLTLSRKLYIHALHSNLGCNIISSVCQKDLLLSSSKTLDSAYCLQAKQTQNRKWAQLRPPQFRSTFPCSFVHDCLLFLSAPLLSPLSPLSLSLLQMIWAVEPCRGTANSQRHEGLQVSRHSLALLALQKLWVGGWVVPSVCYCCCNLLGASD